MKTYSKVGCGDCGWKGSAGYLKTCAYRDGRTVQTPERCPECNSERIFGQSDLEQYPELTRVSRGVTEDGFDCIIVRGPLK